MQAVEARPPYVTFETKGLEDRAASIEKGHYCTVDIDYAIITPQGSKDRIEREVKDWFANLSQQSLEGRFPREWLTHFQASYKAWKDGQELPLSGTPILTWPVVSPAQVKSLLEAQIRTVEDLAGANEESLSRIGMGGRSLKDKAVSWMTQASSGGKVTEELSSMRQANADLKARNDTLEKQLRELAAKVAALTK